MMKQSSDESRIPVDVGIHWRYEMIQKYYREYNGKHNSQFNDRLGDLF